MYGAFGHFLRCPGANGTAVITGTDAMAALKLKAEAKEAKGGQIIEDDVRDIRTFLFLLTKDSRTKYEALITKASGDTAGKLKHAFKKRTHSASHDKAVTEAMAMFT